MLKKLWPNHCQISASMLSCSQLANCSLLDNVITRKITIQMWVGQEFYLHFAWKRLPVRSNINCSMVFSFFPAGEYLWRVPGAPWVSRLRNCNKHSLSHCESPKPAWLTALLYYQLSKQVKQSWWWDTDCQTQLLCLQIFCCDVQQTSDQLIC